MVCSSLHAMEMKQIKTNTSAVSPELLAKVVKVPAISKLLSDNYVTVPLDIAQISFEDQKITLIKPNSSSNEFRYSTSSLNYFNCPNEDGIVLNKSLLLNFDDKTYSKFSIVRDKFNGPQQVTVSDFFFDGPNQNGNCVSCMKTYTGENPLVLFVNKKKSFEKTFWRQSVWSLALSDQGLIAVSSVSHEKQAAFLNILSCKSTVKTRKLLFLSHETTKTELSSVKNSVLSDMSFHAFKNLTFLSESTLLGCNQNGQLYTIKPLCENKDDLPIFNHLTSKDDSFSSVKFYAADSFDKNNLLLVDNNDMVRIAKITPNGLETNIIRSMNDMIEATGNRAQKLRCIRLAGNVCYFFFTTDNGKEELCVQFSLIHKQLSPKEKLDKIKNKIKEKLFARTSLQNLNI